MPPQILSGTGGRGNTCSLLLRLLHHLNIYHQLLAGGDIKFHIDPPVVGLDRIDRKAQDILTFILAMFDSAF